MATLALVVYAAWMVVAFGVRTFVQFQRTGDTGWRGVSGRFATAEWFAGVSFAVALCIGVLGPVADIAGVGALVEEPTLRWTGFVVALIGVGATVAAQMSMRDSWRIGVDRSETTPLRVTGAFRIARNPIFAAMVVTALGLAAMVPNFVSLLGVVALVVAVELQVRVVEEPYLRTVHGEQFLRYERRVGRFVPRWSRLG
jgi:protein-S-isoprenylcysteine O-methyltransferase Ste14